MYGPFGSPFFSLFPIEETRGKVEFVQKNGGVNRWPKRDQVERTNSFFERTCSYYLHCSVTSPKFERIFRSFRELPEHVEGNPFDEPHC